MKILSLALFISLSALCAIMPLKQMNLIGTDSDQLSCELEIEETGDQKGKYKITVNNSEVYYLIDKEFNLKASNKIIKKSTKVSSLNGEHHLVITSKPNGSISYKIIDYDKIHFEKNTYKCSGLRINN